MRLIFFLLLSMYSRDILSTHSGMVAENIKFWVFKFLWLSIILKISSMSSLNPFSNIWSASSIQVASSSPKWMHFLSSKSISLPGVATITSTPFLNSLIWSSIEDPPYTATTLKSDGLCLRLEISLKTWRASYRVGHITKNLTCFLPLLNFPASLNFYKIGKE